MVDLVRGAGTIADLAQPKFHETLTRIRCSKRGKTRRQILLKSTKADHRLKCGLAKRLRFTGQVYRPYVIIYGESLAKHQDGHLFDVFQSHKFEIVKLEKY